MTVMNETKDHLDSTTAISHAQYFTFKFVKSHVTCT